MRLVHLTKFAVALALVTALGNISIAQTAVVEPDTATEAPSTPSSEMKASGGAKQAAAAEGKSALERVTYDIKYLASDELGGRKPGTAGIELAAKYLEEQYKLAGLKRLDNGTYRQDFTVRLGMTVDTEATSLKLISSNSELSMMDLELGKDYMPQARRKPVNFDTDVVFVGYGINAEKDLNYNDYRGVDVDGKFVVMIRREPQQEDPNSVFAGVETSDHSYINSKVSAARRAGATGLIMVNDVVNAPDDERDVLEDPTRFRGTFPFVQVKRRVLDKLLTKSPLIDADGKKLTSLAQIEKQIDATLSPVSQPMKGWKVVGSAAAKQNNATTSNVIGVLEGEGPNANETIVIGGHYDHLGMGGRGSRSSRRAVHNGADDNATGTAAVVELARRFAKRDAKPSRRLVFVCFSAEEMGLLGAKHYVNEDPLYDLTNTATMVNFDMIGWLRENRVTVFNANSSPQFNSVLNDANKGADLEIVKSAAFGGSDHLPFHEQRIPVMFIHTGLTDTYHTPEDDFETIDCEGALRVIDYSEKVIDNLLALENKPVFQTAAEARKNRVQLGVLLNEDVEGGVEITRILPGSLAEQSGFQIGDIITAVGTVATEKRRNLNMEIRKNNGSAVMFKLKRGDQNIEKLIVLQKPADG